MNEKVKPLCKCGKPCVYYGEIGGYSVACVDCNAKNAKRQREKRRKIKVEKDGNVYHGYCPNLKGVHSAGDTYKEAFKNIKIALEEYHKIVLDCLRK